MNQLRLIQNRQCIQQLRREHLDQLCAQPTKGVLLDEFVEVGGEELKDETEVGFMDECVPQTEDVMFVVDVPGVIKLQGSGWSMRTNISMIANMSCQ